jgi:hypothetical protein
MTVGWVAKQDPNSELASRADDNGFTVVGFSLEGLWGIARGASE